jgi:hypothetical protein
MDAGLRLAQYTEQHRDIPRTASISRGLAMPQQPDVEEAHTGMERIDTDITVSFPSYFFTQTGLSGLLCAL